MTANKLCPICKERYCRASVPAAIKGNYVRESATCDSEVCRKEYQKRWQVNRKKRIKQKTMSQIAFGA